MNAPDPDPTPAAITPEPENIGSPVVKPPTSKKPPRELSASTRAFLAQMAENLRTHDPENPKGRLRMKP